MGSAPIASPSLEAAIPYATHAIDGILGARLLTVENSIVTYCERYPHIVGQRIGQVKKDVNQLGIGKVNRIEIMQAGGWRKWKALRCSEKP